jgi:predicted DNA-binding transcriptional regulator AlpA
MIQGLRGKRSAAKRWSGHVSLDLSQPWLAQGISRRTWFRRKIDSISLRGARRMEIPMNALREQGRLGTSMSSTAYLNNLGLIEYAMLCPLLGISRGGLDAMALEEGFPKRVRFGKKFYISESAFHQWIAARTGVPHAA